MKNINKHRRGSGRETKQAVNFDSNFRLMCAMSRLKTSILSGKIVGFFPIKPTKTPTETFIYCRHSVNLCPTLFEAALADILIPFPPSHRVKYH